MERRTCAVILAGAFLGAAALSLSGCATARDPDTGEVVIGVKAGQINATAGQAISSAAGLIGGPAAQWAVSGILGLLGLGGTAAAAHYVGREKGWDQNNAESSTGVQPSAAPSIIVVPTAAAPSAAPVAAVPAAPAPAPAGVA